MLSAMMLVFLGAEDPRPYLGPTAIDPPEPSQASSTSTEQAPAPERDTTRPRSESARGTTASATEAPTAKRLDGEKADEKKKKKDDPFADKVKVHARVMGGFQYDTDHPPPDAAGNPQAEDSDLRFFMRQARFMIRARVGEVLRINLSGDLADAIDPPPGGQVPYLRNAFANAKFTSAVQVRAGYFKRPFSRLELAGSNTLPFRGRGIGNRLIIEDRSWGTRAMGVMLWGSVAKDRVRWYASASTPHPTATNIDAHARLEVDPFTWFSVGASGGYKRTADPLGGSALNLAAATGDLELRLSRWHVMVDVVAAQNAALPHHPFSLSSVGWVSYTVPLQKGFSLQPTVLTEWVDADLEYKQSEAVRVIGGLNVLWRNYVRVLPQVELIRPLGEASYRNPWIEGETYYLMLAVQI